MRISNAAGDHDSGSSVAEIDESRGAGGVCVVHRASCVMANQQGTQRMSKHKWCHLALNRPFACVWPARFRKTRGTDASQPMIM